MKTTEQGFQLCPKCNGEGRVPTTGTSSSTFQMCDICSGEKIIHRNTGYTPLVHRDYLFKRNTWAEKEAKNIVEEIMELIKRDLKPINNKT